MARPEGESRCEILNGCQSIFQDLNGVQDIHHDGRIHEFRKDLRRGAGSVSEGSDKDTHCGNFHLRILMNLQSDHWRGISLKVTVR